MTNRPLWLWPNLLSLDAPLVALAWQLLFARCFHAEWRAIPAIVLALTVWLIYAGDRMLDAARGADREPRHEFYRRHWRVILPMWVAVLIACATLSLVWLDAALLRRGFALLGAVFVYLAAVHLTPAVLRVCDKEAAVAALFALGSSLDSWSYVRTADDALTIAFFSGLCWINCRAIDSWERHVRWPTAGLAACLAIAAAVVLSGSRPVLACAEAASAVAFIYLDRSRVRFSGDALRVLADVALLSPLPLLPIAGRFF